MLKRIVVLALLVWCSSSAARADEPGGHMPSLLGPSGILRVFSADSGPAGTFRFQLTGEYFRASNFLQRNDTNSRVGGRLLIGISPLDWLEVFLTLTAASNDNNQSTPNLIQTQGDFSIGLKGCYRVYDFFCVGAQGSALFLTGAGDTSFTARSTSFLLRLLATTDIQRIAAKVPLRVHFNFGGIIDNSDALLRSSFDNVQRYALRIAESSRLFLGIGLDAPVSRYVTPFLEWSLEIPVGLPPASGDAPASSWPNILSLGARVFPWKQLALLAAVDLGITSAGSRGVPAVPPWQIVFGAGWSFDTRDKPPRVVEKEKIKEVVKERVVTKEVPVPTEAPPTTGTLTGQVVDSKTGQPVGNAAIRFPGAEYTAALSGEARGDFRIPALRTGKLRVRVEKEGYKPADFEVEITAGKDTANSFLVDPVVKPKLGVIVGKVSDERGRPLVGIVEVRNAETGATTKLTTEPATGAYIGRIEAGKVTLLARSTGYLSRERTVTLTPNEREVVDFSLRKEPEKRLARIEGSKIVITQQVRFQTRSARIVGKRSFAILDEVVDILARNPNIKKVRIEGHTDNVGPKAFNMKLSENRARSVLEYLVGQGIAPARLDSAGYGPTRPLVPNTSRRNRAKNRRVEFVIVEQ